MFKKKLKLLKPSNVGHRMYSNSRIPDYFILCFKSGFSTTFNFCDFEKCVVLTKCASKRDYLWILGITRKKNKTVTIQL